MSVTTVKNHAMILNNFISILMKMIIILITVIVVIAIAMRYPKGIYLFCLLIKQFMKM